MSCFLDYNKGIISYYNDRNQIFSLLCFNYAHINTQLFLQTDNEYVWKGSIIPRQRVHMYERNQMISSQSLRLVCCIKTVMGAW